jgi:hypothetical protein
MTLAGEIEHMDRSMPPTAIILASEEEPGNVANCRATICRRQLKRFPKRLDLAEDDARAAEDWYCVPSPANGGTTCDCG